MMETNLSAMADAYFAKSASTIRLLQAVSPQVVQVSGMMADALMAGRTIFWFGNGGSAADAQHLAAELVGRFRNDRTALSSLALTTDTSVLTALGNDYGYDAVFARQVDALCRPGDVVVGITTSGKSVNVLRGLAHARHRGAHTVAFTGRSGSPVDHDADLTIHVPIEETCHVQEAHIVIGQLICQLVEERLGYHA
jgi:D-sedoheptulose 7-phosphate isomerase